MLKIGLKGWQGVCTRKNVCWDLLCQHRQKKRKRQLRYRGSKKYLSKEKRYRSSEKGKALQSRYNASLKGRVRNAWQEERRLHG